MGKNILAISGETASGKSSYAIEKALQINAEIISCDSLLFYKKMDIGTAKPTLAQRQKVPHHLIDICDFNTKFNVKQYEKMALSCINEIFARGKNVIIVGGSGFYLKSFFTKIADDICVSDNLQQSLEEEFTKNGLDFMVEKLSKLNNSNLGSIDLKNPRRVLNYLGRCIASGKSIAEQMEDFSKQKCPFDNFDISLEIISLEREILNKNIENRSSLMIQIGLINEVKELVQMGINNNKSAANSIGYKETLAYLNNEITDIDSLKDLIIKNTKKLAKKQRTWFGQDFIKKLFNENKAFNVQTNHYLA